MGSWEPTAASAVGTIWEEFGKGPQNLVGLSKVSKTDWKTRGFLHSRGTIWEDLKTGPHNLHRYL